jgi:hypothetical protein
MILDTPASRYFHLQGRSASALHVVLPFLAEAGDQTHVASRSSRFGTGGIGVPTVVRVATDMLRLLEARRRWRRGEEIRIEFGFE